MKNVFVFFLGLALMAVPCAAGQTVAVQNSTTGMSVVDVTLNGRFMGLVFPNNHATFETGYMPTKYHLEACYRDELAPEWIFDAPGWATDGSYLGKDALTPSTFGASRVPSMAEIDARVDAIKAAVKMLDKPGSDQQLKQIDQWRKYVKKNGFPTELRCPPGEYPAISDVIFPVQGTTVINIFDGQPELHSEIFIAPPQ